jgi:hypothetical protein
MFHYQPTANGPASKPGQPVPFCASSSEPLHISSIKVDGDFGQTNNCGRQLGAAEASCSINVTFSPKPLGQEHSGTSWIYDDAQDSPQRSPSGCGYPMIGGSLASLAELFFLCYGYRTAQFQNGTNVQKSNTFFASFKNWRFFPQPNYLILLTK